MKLVILKRTETGDQGTFGILETDGFNCKTAELPWRNNQKGISCIPVGEYLCEMEMSPRFKKMLYELRSVPNRGDILIHSGNFAGDKSKGFKTDVEGCILLGFAFGTINGQKAVINSKPTVTAFIKHMETMPFMLRVEEVWKKT